MMRVFVRQLLKKMVVLLVSVVVIMKKSSVVEKLKVFSWSSLSRLRCFLLVLCVILNFCCVLISLVIVFSISVGRMDEMMSRIVVCFLRFCQRFRLFVSSVGRMEKMSMICVVVRVGSGVKVKMRRKVRVLMKMLMMVQSRLIFFYQCRCGEFMMVYVLCLRKSIVFMVY